MVSAVVFFCNSSFFSLILLGKNMADREIGAVKWFSASKGYGFISRSNGEDVFVHFSAIRSDGYRTLNEGQKVEFSLKRGDKGLQAEDVTVVE